ncbi:hypothetical protein [Dyella nitratireducens]|uniref:Uncharacterized protein n=1 Tax=Dyella nitratireducens TaxID=1849580 RepID=A0ABQ1FSV4_9GAMM|nr:hypothetical protein [Dyella nitratireducens]GGA29195.1 hypothetical protein GCM10010981_17590 [Dyella nitratireducens]GLQ43176.1 hypothetical protein GCM10007902_30260 [Dyella nitratireducens]
MNTKRCLLAAVFAVGISVQLAPIYAATVVTHSATPGYAVTTVRTTGPYWGIYPAPCCYTKVVTKGVTSSASVVVTTSVPPPRVVYVMPPVTVYPPRAVYVSTAP